MRASVVVELVAKSIFSYNMFHAGDPVAVAVSGGADSVCLLRILHELSSRLDLRLTVIHLNHGLRGAESDGDADFVRALASELELPCIVESASLAAYDSNLEQAGREARRQMYARVIASGQAKCVATGHTRSDQAETVLYRLLRGSGTAGLAGILPVTPDGIVRPLIHCERRVVEAWLKDRGHTWREDSTNGELRFARNWIRHRLLPLLYETNPAAGHILAATADISRDEESYWDQELSNLATRLLRCSAGVVILEAAELAALHPAVARRLIRRAIRYVKGDLRMIDITHVDDILHLAAPGLGSGRLQAPGVDVFRSFEWLRIARPRSGSRAERDYEFTVASPGSVNLPAGGSIRLDLLELPGTDDTVLEANGYNTGVYWLDADRVGDRLALRNWHPGDAYAPAGQPKTRLKLLFQEARVPLWERQGWPLLWDGDAIVWSRRFGVAQHCAVDATTRRVVQLRETGREDD